MKRASPPPDLPPCTPQLLALAAVIRDDIDQRDLEGAIQAAAQTPGWTWRRIVPTVARLLAAGEEPRDLREATRDPLKRRPA